MQFITYPVLVLPLLGSLLFLPIDMPVELTDIQGKKISIDALQDRQALVMIFVTTDCPIANSYHPKLARLYREFQSQGIVFVLVHEGPNQSKEKLAKHAHEYSVPYPIVMDSDHLIANRWNVSKTPEALVLDKSDATLYQGRIDDMYQGFGKKRIHPTREDLCIALSEIVVGKEVSEPKTDVVGCSIAKKEFKPSASQIDE